MFYATVGEEDTNTSLLQARVHLDSLTALEEGMLQSLEPSSLTMPFDIFGASDRHKSNLISGIVAIGPVHFIGCIAETVRSFLVKRYSTTDAETAVNWTPPLQNHLFAFQRSRQFHACLEMVKENEKYHSSILARILWECQFNLQTQIAIRLKRDKLESDSALILLFILDFPSLPAFKRKESAIESNGVFELIFSPNEGPQAITIAVRCNTKTGEATVELLSDLCTNFSWSEWRNGTNELILDRNADIRKFFIGTKRRNGLIRWM